MRIDIITIFPEYLAPLDQSLLGKAQRSGVVNVRVHDLRNWTDDVHRTVDDTPYGGGGGMVMRPQVWGLAIDSVCATHERADVTQPGLTQAAPTSPRLIVPTPSGRRFNHAMATNYAAQPWLIFACGRYEGIDYRVVEDAATRMPVDEVSIGDYVLAGGEAAALVMMEAITRLIPGVVGNSASVAEDSFADGLLEGPVYTRPAQWRGREVPEVLLSGDHAAIARWRREQALRRTAQRRPDLL